jgi:hypothetical protein
MTRTFHIDAAAQPVFLARFQETLHHHGAGAARSPSTRLSDPGRDEVFYVPFEHMNRAAKLVIVGITPGPEQIKLAYAAVQASLKAGLTTEQVLERSKREGSFGGPKMRPNLLKMLKFFRFSELLGIADAAELWGSSAGLLHATSVVPHAAFRNGKPFADSFEEVLGSEPFQESFKRDFAATLPLMSREAWYVALGPTPLAALDWCAEEGLIKAEQVLGAFAHPSTRGGSEVPVYLGERSIHDLKKRDPVRNRIWLVPEAERMTRSVLAWRSSLLRAA